MMWRHHLWACVRVLLFIGLASTLSVFCINVMRNSPFLIRLAHVDEPSSVLTPFGILPEEIAQLAAAWFSALCLCMVVRPSSRGCRWWEHFLRQTNLYGRRGIALIMKGMLWGWLGATGVIGMIWLCGGYHFHGMASSWDEGVTNLGLYAFSFVLVGAAEESLFRGYVHRQLGESIGFWPASIVTSVLFGAVHFPGGTPVWGAVAAGLAGFVFCVMLRQTGSLVFPIGFHAAWDWTQTALFGVNDSGHAAAGALLRTELHGPYWLTGGNDGPEASLFCFVFFVGVIVWLLQHMKPRLEY